jgi:hypothetical protein
LLAAPERLASSHVLDFDFAVASLNEWLQRRAAQNQASGARRTFACADAGRVVACYARASGARSVPPQHAGCGTGRRAGRLGIDRPRQECRRSL